MTKMIRFAAPLIAVALMTAPVVASAQMSQNNNQTQNNDWSAPPAGTEQAQAYKDGIEAAKLDTVAGRKVDPQASYLYNHPKGKKAADKEAYRSTFTQGYKAALAHQGNGNGGL